MVGEEAAIPEALLGSTAAALGGDAGGCGGDGGAAGGGSGGGPGGMAAFVSAFVVVGGVGSLNLGAHFGGALKTTVLQAGAAGLLEGIAGLRLAAPPGPF